MRLLLSSTLSLVLLSGCGGGATGAGGGGSGGDGGAGGAGAAGGAGGAAGGAGGAASCQPSFDGETLHLAVGATLAAGEDQTLCLRWTVPEALDITAFVGTLGALGHHALLLVHPTASGPDGVSPCNEAELMDAATLGGGFQMLAGVSYESDGVPYVFPSSPVQIGLSVPAGAQLVFDGHFLNAGDFEETGCATLDLSVGAPVVAKLEFHTVLPPEEYGLVVPAADSVDVSYTEVFPSAYRVAAASSHMHEGGTHFLMTIDETGEVLYESFDWAEPQPKAFDGAPVVIGAGQTVRIDCSFSNATAMDQSFPDQMCVGGMYLLPCTFPGACP